MERERERERERVKEKIETAKLRLFGHKKRMTNNRLPKNIFYESRPKGGTTSRRPKLTWTQSVVQTMRD